MFTLEANDLFIDFHKQHFIVDIFCLYCIHAPFVNSQGRAFLLQTNSEKPSSVEEKQRKIPPEAKSCNANTRALTEVLLWGKTRLATERSDLACSTLDKLTCQRGGKQYIPKPAGRPLQALRFKSAWDAEVELEWSWLMWNTHSLHLWGWRWEVVRATTGFPRDEGRELLPQFPQPKKRGKKNT